MKVFVFCLLFIQLISELESCPTSSEQDVIMSLGSHLNLKSFIFLDFLEDCKLFSRLTSLFKNSAHFHVLLALMYPSQFSDHIEEKLFPQGHTGIILKALDVASLNRYLSEVKLETCCSRFTWIAFIPPGHLQHLTLNIPYNCEFIIVQDTQGGVASFHLSEVYRIKNHEDLAQVHLGTWDREVGLTFVDVWFYGRRADMAGVKLSMYKDTEDLCKNSYQCKHREIWFGTGRIMNFTTVEISASELQRNNGNLPLDGAINVIAFHANSFRFDAVAPILSVRVNMYIKRELLQVTWLSAYIRPLSPSVWVAILLWLVVSSTALLFIHCCSPAPGLHITDCGFRPFESFCNQAGSGSPTALSLQTACFMTHLVAAVIIPVYSASVIAFFTVQFNKIPFTDLQSFVEEGSYSLAAINQSFAATYFETSIDDEVVQTIVEKHLVSAEEMPAEYEDAVVRICQEERYAFLAFEDDLPVVWEETRPCEIDQLPRPVFQTFTGNALVSNSPYRTIFNKILLRFYTSGLIHRMRLNQTTSLKAPRFISRQSEIQLHFFQVLPILLLIPCSIVLSLLLLHLERHHKAHNHIATFVD